MGDWPSSCGTMLRCPGDAWSKAKRQRYATPAYAHPISIMSHLQPTAAVYPPPPPNPLPVIWVTAGSSTFNPTLMYRVYAGLTFPDHTILKHFRNPYVVVVSIPFGPRRYLPSPSWTRFPLPLHSHRRLRGVLAVHFRKRSLHWYRIWTEIVVGAVYIELLRLTLFGTRSCASVCCTLYTGDVLRGN